MATNRIKELRLQKELTQTELGQIVNVQKSAISKYEKGRAEPSMDILRKFANFFNVSTDYILCRTDDPTPPDSGTQRPPVPDAGSIATLSAREQKHIEKYRVLSDDSKDAIDNQTDFLYDREQSLEESSQTGNAS